MTVAKTALLSILIACWIVGLVNQFHAWAPTLTYLILSLLIVTIVALRSAYTRQYAKNKIRRRP